MILRPRRLAAALRSDGLSERDKFTYLLAGTVITAVAEQRVQSWNGWSGARLLFVAGSLLIVVLGLLVCFQANARGDNRAFLERYICLAVPVGVVTYAIYYLLYYGMAVIGLALGWVASDAHNWNSVAMAALSSIAALTVFFVWMRALLLDASGLRTA